MSGIAKIWNKIDSQFIRFIFVGILNTAFGYGVYCLMLWMGLSYWWATLIANILGVLFNFKTIGILVFENPSNRLFFKFALCYVLAYFLNVGIIALFTHFTTINQYVSGFVATICVALFSFFFQKFIVFKEETENRNRKLTSDI